jgi:O-antigen/teichoic acid export membrane protein
MNINGFGKGLLKFVQTTRQQLNRKEASSNSPPSSDQEGSLKNLLIRRVMGLFSLKIFSTGLGLVTSILLARLLGTEGFGSYSYIIAWSLLLSIPATMGLGQLTVREVAIYHSQSEWGLINGFLKWTNKRVAIVSITLALLAIGIAWLLRMKMLWAFSLAMISIPIESFRKLRLATLKGLHQVIIGQLPEMLIGPLLLLILIGFAHLFLGSALTVSWVVAMNGLTMLISLLIGMRLLARAFPEAVQKAIPKYEAQKWRASVLPFMLMGGLVMIKTRSDILMLGLLAGKKEVAVYVAANRAVEVINFVLIVVNTSLSSTIASLYAEGKIKKIKHLMVRTTRMVLVVSLLLAVGLIGISRWYLLLFGADFIQGQLALIVLCLAMVVKATWGWSSMLMTMTGQERYTTVIMSSSVMANIILNALLIPKWGVNGAAIATAITTVVSQTVMTISTFKQFFNGGQTSN